MGQNAPLGPSFNQHGSSLRTKNKTTQNINILLVPQLTSQPFERLESNSTLSAPQLRPDQTGVIILHVNSVDDDPNKMVA